MAEPFHPDKGPYLADLPPGERFVGFYTLRNKHLDTFRDPTRGQFLTLTLADRSGQRIGRVWEDAPAVYDELQVGDTLKLEGESEDFQGRLQIRVLRVRPANPNEYDPRDLLPSSQRDPQEMLAELNAARAALANPHLAALLAFFFEDSGFLNRFVQAPAAKKVHHAYLHGLLEHCLEMLALTPTLAAHYPDLDHDLLITGILLHDIGKLREYEWDVDIDLTTEGRLVGHVVLTDEALTEALTHLPEFPPELALRLRHMLLAHPGRVEYGAARRPMTLEAVALHHLDTLSTQLNRVSGLLAERPPHQPWTDYIRGLGRSLYGGRDDDLNLEERSRTE